MSRRYLWALSGLGAVVVLVTASYSYYIYSQPLILSRSAIADAQFAVYTPKSAPHGYTTSQDETKLSSNMLSYVFNDTKQSRSITVTVQPAPREFDMRQLIGDGSVASTAVSTGTLYNLSAGNSSRYLLDTGDSLVFLTSADKIDTATINALAASLEKRN